MFGVNGGELVVLLLLAAVVIGPERLPRYAEDLARWVRTWRATLTTTKQRLAAELGEDDVDWEALDPRRYDPRRIVREALTEPEPGSASARAAASSWAAASSGISSAASSAASSGTSSGTAPYDDEAT